MRLFTYIKNYANLTKSKVMELYNDKRITVNGIKQGIRYKVNDNDIVRIDNKIINKIEFKYYLYYKPKGILSIINNNSNSYINNINLATRLALAGRLDKNSEGLMILTNDGKFINDIMNPTSKLEKEYIVKLKYPITDTFMENIKKEYTIKNRETTPIIAKKINEFTISMILFEGIYHQIRKIVILANNKVENLKRIRIGQYMLGNLNPGEILEFNK